MKVFKIKITESLSRIVEIEAGTSTDAVEKVKGLYKNAVITLDSSDYTEVNICEVEDAELIEKMSGKNVKSLN
ncbi:MAG: hypothetical protein A2W93_13905 [Bacteroidetes bacterium GWF2_43_63]|nr:MAG: hypothetical protein A2W94_04100 [Bacteroidetes bacterium GWE2_42_42]OFY55081.1 MAG: hypothetical protein A2W93_13905 [Bacteroidetes bacterium GWF2_43_63]HBG69618.1 hypothetical protein [Bacteroidales bacterium]HCB60643.1 hypothetical protein [Bacteroidales bacterium]HCY24053.1 hypothetical protein [Bacteroidales bacterium]